MHMCERSMVLINVSKHKKINRERNNPFALTFCLRLFAVYGFAQVNRLSVLRGSTAATSSCQTCRVLSCLAFFIVAMTFRAQSLVGWTTEESTARSAK